MTQAGGSVRADAVRRTVAGVVDPEIPVLTIEDLGILRDVRVDGSGHVDVDITPTYSGCPALDVIRHDVEARLHDQGHADVAVNVVLSPAWSTDWMSAAGREKLREYGVAPPRRREGGRLLELAVACPVCDESHTSEVAHFASTPCQALRRCSACAEPFQHFKEH